ncbi:hypothetical protein PENSPDRAFT_645366 [Peniophora sp. CONT]|nr:hypothetical protein PENSPDRAFT_645366 [Peniophora sp. CONT]
MRASLASLALLPATALALSITGPSDSAYWVANTSKTISWTTSSGDPAQVDVVLTNPNNQTLNGDFFVARFLNTSAESFTITNVTIRAGDDYQVVFVNPANASQVYANSSDFSVKPAGTPAAATSSAASSSASSTASASGSSTGSASASAASSTQSSAASPLAGISFGSAIYALGACALAAVGGALL